MGKALSKWSFLMRGLWLGLLLLTLAAAYGHSGTDGEPRYRSSAPADAGKVYVFGIHPLHNPQRLFDVYGPLIDYLERNMGGVDFQLEASRNYDAFERKLYGRQFDFALPNANHTLNALRHGYGVIAKMGDDHKFAGIILVRRDSGIQQVSDLKGRKVAYPSPSSLAAGMLSQYYLQTHGLDVNRDIENLYVGSQESSIMNVYLGNVAAGATWILPWESFQKEHPAEARTLEVKWQTEPLINNAVVARNDVPPKVSARVARLLVTLHTTKEGRAILARLPLSRFELADNARYRGIEPFLREFDRTVRPRKDVCP
jgi:phosphonate transport system substrate-binding protein